MFFKYFASKSQLPGLSMNGTLVENGLRESHKLDLEFKKFGQVFKKLVRVIIKLGHVFLL